MQHKGQRRVPLSEKQRARNELFRLAAAYGNRVKMDPTLSAEYRRFGSGCMRACHAAVRDFLTPPRIEAVDSKAFTGQPGQRIRVIASDDTGVISVQVVLRHAVDGMLLEQGAAEPTTTPNEWQYRTSTAVTGATPLTLEVTVMDRPGNTVTFQTSLVVL